MAPRTAAAPGIVGLRKLHPQGPLTVLLAHDFRTCPLFFASLLKTPDICDTCPLHPRVLIEDTGVLREDGPGCCLQETQQVVGHRAGHSAALCTRLGALSSSLW